MAAHDEEVTHCERLRSTLTEQADLRARYQRERALDDEAERLFKTLRDELA